MCKGRVWVKFDLPSILYKKNIGHLIPFSIPCEWVSQTRLAKLLSERGLGVGEGGG